MTKPPGWPSDVELAAARNQVSMPVYLSRLRSGATPLDSPNDDEQLYESLFGR